jgi:hypothetical protein
VIVELDERPFDDFIDCIQTGYSGTYPEQGRE